MDTTVYIMTMPERMNHVKTQLHVLENTQIIESYNDINMIISNEYVETFQLKRKELCAYTYIDTILKFIKSEKEICIILEDDVIIKPELKNDIDILSNICKNYDFIYLYKLKNNYKNIITIDNIQFIDNISDGNQAIMWSRQGALKLMNNLPIKIAKDYWMKKKIAKGIFNALTTKFDYVINIGALNERDVRSKMGSTIYNIDPIR